MNNVCHGSEPSYLLARWFFDHALIYSLRKNKSWLAPPIFQFANNLLIGFKICEFYILPTTPNSIISCKRKMTQHYTQSKPFSRNYLWKVIWRAICKGQYIDLNVSKLTFSKRVWSRPSVRSPLQLFKQRCLARKNTNMSCFSFSEFGKTFANQKL